MVESDVMKVLKPFHLSLQDEILSVCARLEELKKELNTKWEEKGQPVHTNNHKVGELECQVDLVTKALASHPKLIKMKDRVNHSNNTLIIGIQENSKEEQEDTMAKVHELLDTKLGMKANTTQERKLGKDK